MHILSRIMLSVDNNNQDRWADNFNYNSISLNTLFIILEYEIGKN